MHLILNFKTYPEATGENAVVLARVAASVQLPAGVNVIICPQAADIFRIREQLPHLTIWAQHIDPIDDGKNTGWTSVTSVVMAGANGTIINHSEHPLSSEDISQAVEIAKKYNLTSCVAAATLEIAQQLAGFHPDMLAFEPPELISTGTSLVDVNPQSAADFVSALQPSGIQLILGAGVADSRDLAAAKSLGYAGVLLSSAFVKASDPTQFLAQLVTGFASQ